MWCHLKSPPQHSLFSYNITSRSILFLLYYCNLASITILGIKQSCIYPFLVIFNIVELGNKMDLVISYIIATVTNYSITSISFFFASLNEANNKEKLQFDQLGFNIQQHFDITTWYQSSVWLIGRQKLLTYSCSQWLSQCRLHNCVCIYGLGQLLPYDERPLPTLMKRSESQLQTLAKQMLSPLDPSSPRSPGVMGEPEPLPEKA